VKVLVDFHDGACVCRFLPASCALSAAILAYHSGELTERPLSTFTDGATIVIRHSGYSGGPGMKQEAL